MNAPKILFMGSKRFGYKLITKLVKKFTNVEWILFHPNDLSDPRSAYAEFKQINGKNVNLKFIKNRYEFNDEIKNIEFQFAIVCGWYWIIPSDILVPRDRPFYGIHHSDLPSYRGGAPLTWAIINGEKRIGSSLFRIKDGIDDGEIIEKVYCDISDHDTISSVMSSLERAWLSKIESIFPKMVAGDVETMEQLAENISYCAQRHPSDGKIDWTKNARDVHNFVRAQSYPYPGAYTTVANEIVIIDEVAVFEHPYYAIPGKIIRHSNNEVLIGCGEATAIVLKKLRDNENILDVFGRDRYLV
jgi:methionyl-tRNA formyltransferase